MGSSIDVSFDFTSDTPGFWQNYWEKDALLGCAGNDPDRSSKTLKAYHRFLWSKPLPNGQKMELQFGAAPDYLNWSRFRFGSDSIAASFRYKKNRNNIKALSDSLPNYHSFMEAYVHKSYTIGGEILFPKRPGGINQSRGCNPLIGDRFDLTLECIRRFYQGKESPLSSVLQKDKEFFDLFLDFKGYIDFFFLQDFVSEYYRGIIFWLPQQPFASSPLPLSPRDHIQCIHTELDLIAKRNRRIVKSVEKSSGRPL